MRFVLEPSASECRLALLGRGVIVCGRTETPLHVPEKALELAAFLIVNSGPVRRSYASQTLWPDDSEEASRSNLRRHLYGLAQALPGTDSDAWFTADKVHLCWNHATGWTDVAQFEEFCRRGEAAAAIELYRGDLLPECYADWIEPHRARLRDAALALLRTLALHADAAVAIGAAQRALQMEPLDERMLRTLMQRRAAIGDRGGAVARYREFERYLSAELDAMPEEETRGLFEELLLRSGPSANFSLPRAHTSFIGRSGELKDLLDSLERERVVTITGPGGVGKTRLALEAGAQILGTVRGGVWFVDLSTIASDEEVAEQIRRAFGESASHGDALETVLASIGSTDTLVVLDNCEHVAAGARAAVTAISGRTAARVLCTSRRALNIPGEFRVLLAPLVVPEDERETPQSIVQVPAVHLFVERAGTVRGPLAVSYDNAHLLAQIVKQLDGMPLAIELAAARTGVLTLEGIAKRTLDGITVLSRAGMHATTHRHAALDSTIAWSVALLSESELALFAALAVFPDDFDMIAAQAICAPETDTDQDIFPHLSELVEASLLSASPSGDLVRYRLHATIKRYARSLPQAALEQHARRHALYFLEQTTLLADIRKRRGAAAYIASVHPDHTNFLTALRWFAEHDTIDQATAMSVEMLQYWERFGYVKQGSEIVAGLLSKYGCMPFEGAPARLLRCAGTLANARGEWGLAVELNTHAERAFEVAGERREALSAQLGAAHARSYAGEPLEKTIVAYERAYAQAIADGESGAEILANLGAMYVSAGNTAVAREHLLKALAHFREDDDLHNAANVLRILARSYRDDAAYDDALACAEQSEELFMELGDLANAADAARIVAQVQRLHSRLEDARAHLARSLSLLEQSYDPRFATYVAAEAARLLHAGEHLHQSAQVVGFVAAIQTRHAIRKELVADEPFVPDLKARLGEAFERNAALGAGMTLGSVRRVLEREFPES